MSTRTSPDFSKDLVAIIPHLRAFSRMLCGRRGVADDLTQEALTKAWRSRDAFEPGTNLKAWVFTILRNEFYSQARKKGREVQDSDGVFTEKLAVHPGQYGSLDLQDFSKALKQLPEDQREALLLVGASGFAYEEVAQICECRVGTIKSRVSRARARLQEILEIDGEADFGPDKASAATTLRSFAS